MKNCIICKDLKPLIEYYVHNQMADGHLNKCKTCCRLQSKEREIKLRKNPEWIKLERKRHREKYSRLGYKEKQLIWDKDKIWKKNQKYKNLSRKLKTPKGIELHHWNYNDEYLEDVFLMDIKSHRSIHKLIVLDIDKRIFYVLGTSIYLDTREKHIDFIIKSGLKFKEPN